MSRNTLLGIDVGGRRKGLHAVAMRGREFEPRHLRSVAEALEWVRALQPAAIAVDAPCSWSQHGRSRACERNLEIHGERISCFSTPTSHGAAGRRFYDWVRHGLELYAALAPDYPLYQGGSVRCPVICETFPQAVACWLAGRKVTARRKSTVRRQVLRDAGYDPTDLGNVDTVDAALCAIAAGSLVAGRFERFGDPREGYIVVPLSGTRAAG